MFGINNISYSAHTSQSYQKTTHPNAGVRKDMTPV